LLVNVCCCATEPVPVLTCSPCGVPLGDLTLSWSGGTFPAGSITLVHTVELDGFGDPFDYWSGSHTFTYPDDGPAPYGDVLISFFVRCDSGTMNFGATNTVTAVQNCQTPCTIGAGRCFSEVTADRDCDPFHMHWLTTVSPNIGNCGMFYQTGGSAYSFITDFFIDF
jgi:hypothetical protein